MPSLDAAIRLLFGVPADPLPGTTQTVIPSSDLSDAWRLRPEEVDEAVLTGKLPEACLDHMAPPAGDALRAQLTGDDA